VTVEQPQATRYTGSVCNIILTVEPKAHAMAWTGKRKPAIRDALIVALLAAIVASVAHLVASFEVIAGWSRRHEGWHAGVLLRANLSLAFALAVFAWHRSAEQLGRLDKCRRAEEALRARE
jgi:hypothetical protein